MEMVTVSGMRRMKRKGRRITMITAYDYPTALLVERSGIDSILVGDSVGNVVLGYKNTIPVTVDDIVHHTKAVVRGTKRALIVGDMPFMSYHVSLEDTIRNAGRIIKEGGADAVKLEGGRGVAEKVRTLVDVGIPVQAHIGLMPQRASVGGRFRVKGRKAETAMKILEDAVSLEEAGAFSIVLEFVTSEVAQTITERLSIPTIGIGAGPHCDGQILVIHDLLGINEHAPSFVKKYANLNEIILRALEDYTEEVRGDTFPGNEYTVRMSPEERQRLKQLLENP